MKENLNKPDYSGVIIVCTLISCITLLAALGRDDAALSLVVLAFAAFFFIDM